MDWESPSQKKDKKQEGVNEGNRAVVEVTHVWVSRSCHLRLAFPALTLCIYYKHVTSQKNQVRLIRKL